VGAAQLADYLDFDLADAEFRRASPVAGRSTARSPLSVADCREGASIVAEPTKGAGASIVAVAGSAAVRSGIGLFFEFLAHTGLRISEAAGLRADDLRQELDLEQIWESPVQLRIEDS
jgi:hypothetical protein